MLRKQVAKEVVRALWRTARRDGAGDGVRCPSCLQAMRAVDVEGYGGLQALDVCTRCHFVWFDTGELEALPESDGEDAPAAASLRPRSRAAAEAAAEFQLAHLARMRRHEGGTELPAQGWHYGPALLGLPVEFDAHPVRRVPWATLGLLVLLAGIGIWAFGDIDDLVAAYGFLPTDALRLGGLTLLTSFFLHVGWMHLIGNGWFLWVFGDNSEDVLGRGRFLLLVLLATLLGHAAHALTTATPELPCVGASGGVSGVVAYYALRFPRARIGLLFYWVFWLKLAARWWFLIWVGLQVLGASLDGTGVAYMAHLGGAAVGLAFWQLERVGDQRAAA